MSTPQVRPEDFVASMEQQVQEYLQAVMQAVNLAPDGEWIAGSEEEVRDLSAEFRRQVFEQAIQTRRWQDKHQRTADADEPLCCQ